MSDYINKQILYDWLDKDIKMIEMAYEGREQSLQITLIVALREFIKTEPSGNTGELHRIMAVNQQLEIELAEAKAVKDLAVKESEKLKKQLQASRDSVCGISVESDEAKCEAREAKEIANLAVKVLEQIVTIWGWGSDTIGKDMYKEAKAALEEIRRSTDAPT